MLSYHNDQAVKDKYVSRFEHHRAMDDVIQGTGYDNGRGCFVGCTLNNYDHNRFPVELGWPVWMAKLADRIFEELPKKEAPQFGSDLLAAVPIGKDLQPVRHMLAIRRNTRLIMLLKGMRSRRNATINRLLNDTITAIEVCRSCHEAELGGNFCDWDSAWRRARDAAALAAAYDAAALASAALAASAYYDAAYAAALAAGAAYAADDAHKKAWQVERDDLLDILRSL